MESLRRATGRTPRVGNRFPPVLGRIELFYALTSCMSRDEGLSIECSTIVRSSSSISATLPEIVW
jgi:hypothetical protein